MKTSEKLAALAERELPSLINQIILEDGEKFRVYGRYTIKQTADGFAVTRGESPIAVFTSSRSALAWCASDNNNKLNLAWQIQHLDATLSRQRNNIQIRRQKAQNSHGMFWETVTTKVAYRSEQCQQVENELSKCINLAKYWQLQGFPNETARTGRNTPNTTNR